VSLVLRLAELPAVDRGGGVRTIHLARAGTFTTGITELPPGASVPLHWHDCEESVTVLDGEAAFEEEEGVRLLGAGDTTLVPPQAPHRFTNAGDRTLRILWVYGSAAPTPDARGDR
jgi:quercetin dioxygenase-like cupin family protein